MSRWKQVKLGDECKECKTILSPFNVVYTRNCIRSVCKDCHAKYKKEYRIQNIESRTSSLLKQRYGISLEEYQKKLEIQQNKCAICNETCKTGKALAVDHNHGTNQIRDLLCRRCNAVVGLVEESEILLSAIIAYLKKHEAKVG